ncbi:hypothetical protein [Rhodococcus ruber]|uniref:hypothetical protein n=1 Tax=Rhodococcus ruber TaxID=1830 RepID=UPI0007CD8DE2|nr:hypothetical protein [Rhodococcus ruber]AWG97660.1 hypothetical protein DCN13_03270 [Rhodococcus ruber]
MDSSTRARSWAKAPDFAGQPARVEAVRAQTAIDKINYLDSGLHEVQCRECGTCVLVRKNSFDHTSVQWREDPAAVCPNFRGSEVPGALRDGCPQLRASIEQAVLDGRITIPD